MTFYSDKQQYGHLINQQIKLFYLIITVVFHYIFITIWRHKPVIIKSYSYWQIHTTNKHVYMFITCLYMINMETRSKVCRMWVCLFFDFQLYLTLTCSKNPHCLILYSCISAPPAITHNHPQCQSARQNKVTTRMVRKQQANIAYGGSALPLVVNEVWLCWTLSLPSVQNMLGYGADMLHCCVDVTWDSW